MAQSKPFKLPKFSILVCGTTGVGKSSLINYLLGKDVCEVGDPGEVDEDDADEAFDRKTVKVSKQEMIINGVSVTIFDSPGLQDGTADEPKYLADMLENCRDVDLVFYCHEMIATRWTPPEVYSVRLLTETFGNTFWDKAILVLTKANLVRPVKEVTKEEKKEYFRKMKVYKETKFRTEVAKQVNCTREHPNGIDNIPAVPAGSEAVQFLLDGKHFIGNLWVTCLERLPSNQVELFMQATGSTSRIVSSDDVKGSVLPGFIPTREDLVKAWEVMFRRRKQEMKDKQSVQATVQEESQPESHPSLGVTTDDHFESRVQSSPQLAAKSSQKLVTCRRVFTSNDDKPPKYPIFLDQEEHLRLTTLLSRVLKATAVGAVVGTAIFPVVGTVVGAAAGFSAGGGISLLYKFYKLLNDDRQ